MIKKIVAALIVCVTMIPGFGCGGGNTVPVANPDAAAQPGAALQEAERAQQAGEPLSGREQRLLKNKAQDQASPQEGTAQ